MGGKPFVSRSPVPGPLEPLTQREREILVCLADSWSNQEIAQRLHLSEKTVRWYNSQIYSKLGAANRQEAVERAQTLGLLDATADTPPPESRHNLPPQATPFVGRQNELAEITALLDDSNTRLITILAPGGMGKTRLSLEAARLQIGRYPDGVFFVPLSPLNSAGDIASTMADNLGLSLFGQLPALRQLINFLRTRVMLIVLDNFEHLLDGTDLLSQILQQAPAIRLLITSRERLQLQEEWVYKVSGLAVPAHGQTVAPESYSAIGLFMQHARRAGYNPTDGDTESIIRVCQLVEGMPLAIELAAAWTRTLSCDDIAGEIARSLDILESSARNIPHRHSTMRAVFEPTWARLSDDEQRAFMKLSVFHGGFTREAADSVAAASLRTLSALVDKSLLRGVNHGRNDIHELLRQFAYEKLKESGTAAVARDRHRAYFLAFAEQAGRELFSANQVEWFERLEAELSNLRAAIAWSMESGDILGTVRLTASVYRFWAAHSYHQDGYERLVDLLSRPEVSARTATRAMALQAAAYIRWFEGNNADTRSAPSQSNNADSRRLLEEAIAIAREVGDLPLLADAVQLLGSVLFSLGEYEAAQTTLEESLALTQQLASRYGIGWSIAFLGDLALHAGKREQAQQFYQESIHLLREVKDANFLAYVLRRLAILLIGERRYERAETLCQESLELNRITGDRRGVAACLVALASLVMAAGDAVRAAHFLGAAEAILTGISVGLLLTDQLEFERNLELARSQLDNQAFTQAWSSGRSMTMEQAMAYSRTNSPAR